MPVLTVGADTPTGEAIVEALPAREGETVAFVTDSDAAERYKDLGVRVAMGDVSDASHVGGAGLSTCLVPLDIMPPTTATRFTPTHPHSHSGFSHSQDSPGGTD